MEKVDIEDYGFHPPVPKKGQRTGGPKTDGYKHDFIAKRLGFPSGTADSYRNFRRKFRNKVARYLGTLEDLR